jgi:DNA-binding NarL/FixJ family response regulator
VLIADDHDLLRKSVATFINKQAGIKVVGTAANGAEAVERCGTYQPHVVLMDIAMPVMDGLEATRIIRQKYPHIAVVIWTVFSTAADQAAALAAGATCCLQKDGNLRQIVDAIRAAVQ